MLVGPERRKEQELAFFRRNLHRLVAELGLAARPLDIVEIPDRYQLAVAQFVAAPVDVPVIELAGGSHELSHRQLVAIWYLNGVEGPGGETEFRHQAVKVTPEEGKLLLFPPFWTHEHRGAVLERGVKYIATTWVVFA